MVLEFYQASNVKRNLPLSESDRGRFPLYVCTVAGTYLRCYILICVHVTAPSFGKAVPLPSCQSSQPGREVLAQALYIVVRIDALALGAMVAKNKP